MSHKTPQPAAQKQAMETFSTAAMEIASKRWSHTIKFNTTLKPETVAEQVAEECNVPLATAYGWLVGHSLPNSTQMEFMLDVLMKDEDWRENDTLRESGYQLLDLHEKTLNMFGEHPPAAMTDEQMHATTRQPRETLSIGGHTGILTLHDTKGLEPRKHPDLVAGEKNPQRYEELKTDVLLHIQQDTRNLPEFLTVSRLLKGLTQKEVEEMSGLPSIRKYEIGVTVGGTIIPPVATLQKLSNALFSDTQNNDMFSQKMGELACRNRAQLIASAPDWPDSISTTHSIANYEAELPAPYFYEQLRRHAGGAPEEAPDWANHPPIAITPITSKGQYLKAARCALNLSFNQVSAATSYTETTIQTTEGYNSNYPQRQPRAACLDLYEEKAAEKGWSKLINKAAYNTLPDVPRQSATERLRAERERSSPNGRRSS